MRNNITSIIHLDGPDKTGKTTLVKKIIERTNGNFLVYDRSYLSQVVYAKLKNRDVDVQQFINKAAEAQERGEIFIFLNPTKLMSIQQRFELHQAKDLKFSEYKHHLTTFREQASVFKNNGCLYFELDTTIFTPDECVNEILRIANEDYIQSCKFCALHKLSCNIYEQYTGNGKLIPEVKSEVEFMFVGMNPSQKRIQNNIYPFEVLVDKESQKNKVFKDALNELDITQKSYITNAVKCSTENNKIDDNDLKACLHILKSEINQFKPKVIVAMSQQVYDFLVPRVNKKIQLVKIYHPAYQYAYNRMTEDEYKEHVKNVLAPYIIK